MDTVGIADIGRLDASELDELLQRAIDPYVPVELFYAVLDRIGQPLAAVPEPAVDPAPAEPDHESEFDLEYGAPALPDATVLMEQVDQLEAAMAGD